MKNSNDFIELAHPVAPGDLRPSNIISGRHRLQIIYLICPISKHFSCLLDRTLVYLSDLCVALSNGQLKESLYPVHGTFHKDGVGVHHSNLV